MRIPFSLRTVVLAVFLFAVLLWFITPVASINSATCERIRPGMTEQQAQEIVGTPPGWYDGVGGISTNAPGYKGYKPYWIGFRGEIRVDLDYSGRVTQAEFYPANSLHWSPVDCLWERFTRITYAGLSLPTRIVLQSVLSAVIIFMLGVVIIRADANNQMALHGLIGLVAGPVLSIAVLSDGFFVDFLITSLMLFSPVLGGVLGIAVAFIRGLFASRFAQMPKEHDLEFTANAT